MPNEPDSAHQEPGDPAEILELFRDLPDSGAREALAQEYLPFAEHLARRFAGRGEPVEDLVQVACVGLLHAIDRFGTFIAYLPMTPDVWEKLEKEFVYHDAKHPSEVVLPAQR